MVRPTIWFGILLCLFGAGSYLGTGGASLTALIPAFLGLPMVLLGIAARRGQNPVPLHLAAGLGLLGLIGTLGGLSGVASALLLGGKAIPPMSLILQAVMALGCAVFLALYVRNMLLKRQPAR